MADAFALGGLFELAAATFAFEYYLGILLYTMPVLQRRTKGFGIGLMRESPNNIAFLLLIGPLAAFLVQFQGDVATAAQTLYTNVKPTTDAMLSCQYTIINNTTWTGVLTFLTGLAVQIVRFIVTGIPPNLLQVAAAAASAADTVANVYAPISQLVGLAIVTQTTLAAFAVMMANNWTVFADMGVFLYIIPLRLTRRTATFLLAFGMIGYALIPLYAKVQQLMTDWLNAQVTQGGWLASFALGLVCGTTLLTAITDVTAPVLYFGFLGWLSIGGMAGTGFKRLVSRGFGEASPLSAATALRSSVLQGVGTVGGTVESTVGKHVSHRRAEQTVNQAATDIKEARREGRVMGVRLAEGMFDRAKGSLLDGRVKQARQYALRASEYAHAAEKPPDYDPESHGGLDPATLQWAFSGSAYMTSEHDEHYSGAAYQPLNADEERSVLEDEHRIRAGILRDDLRNVTTPEQRLRVGKAFARLQGQRIQHYANLFADGTIDEEELRASLKEVLGSRWREPLAGKQKQTVDRQVERVIQAEKNRRRRHETFPAKSQAEWEAEQREAEQQRREEGASKAMGETHEDQSMHDLDAILRQTHQKAEDMVGGKSLSHEPDTAESRLDKYLREHLRSSKKSSK